MRLSMCRQTPFFAVTDADGHFEIKGLPAGTYTWRRCTRRWASRTSTVTVEPQETAKADFSFQREVSRLQMAEAR